MKSILAALLCLLSASSATRAQDVVRVADIGIVPNAPFYLGIENGDFKRAGLDVRLEKFASAVNAMAPLSTGDIEVVAGGVSPGLFNAFARGWPVKIVAPFGRDSATNSVDAIMVRADLKASVTKLADLKGRKIAVVAPSSAPVYMLARALAPVGLTLKDVEVVAIPYPDQEAALVNKAIDAAISIEPFVTLLQDRGVASLMMRAGDIPSLANPGWQVAVVLYNETWAQKNPRAANEFMAIYLKGAREFESAINKGPNRASMIDLLIRNTRVKDRGVYDRMHWGYIDPNGVILRDSLRDQADWYLQQGMVTKKIEIDQIIDGRYVKFALDKLGVQR
jgi:ABC-type nitrate/sulfonate/bicarbonate transport system substrate-binding protein